MLQEAECIKGKHPESGGARREITCWHQAEDSDAWCQQVISRLAPPNERVFSFYTVLLFLWRRRREIFRSAFYYVIHHAVPRGGGSRSFLRDTLKYGINPADGLVQERRNSSALEMELRLSCTNSSI